MAFLLNTDVKPDVLVLLLFNNMGGHGILNVPGTYQLTTGDSRDETCGICAAILADIDPATETFAQMFFALGQGTLTVTRADAAGMAGRVQGLRFRHVVLVGGVTREIDDGCAVTIDEVQFDLPYSQQASADIAIAIHLPVLRGAIEGDLHRSTRSIGRPDR